MTALHPAPRIASSEGVLDALYTDPSDPGYAPTVRNSINDNSVPSRIYLNLSGTLNIGDSWEEGRGAQVFFRAHRPWAAVAESAANLTERRLQ